MKIGIDISQIVYEGTGVARFTEGLVSSILEFDRSNEWTFFMSSLRRQPSHNIKTSIINHGHRFVEWYIPPRMLSFLWNDIHHYSSPFVPDGQLVKGLDWFVTSDWTEPLLHVKKATIVHDLVFKKYPETVQKQILHTQQKRLQWVSKESKVIFCDSQQTAYDLKDIYHVADQKLVVNYPGVNVTKVDPTTNTLKKYGISENFILTVGKQEPRKNYSRLIDAYEKLEIPNKPELLIIGMKGWGSKEKNVKGVHYLGFVQDEELAELYSKALFFVFPSLYEGFGYPLVEAMLYGCPTTVSGTSSLKEIAGDSSLLFDPADIQSIQESLYRMISDETLRQEFSEKGFHIASSFTWRRYYDTFISTLSERV